MKKLIITILIIGLVLSLNFNLFLFKPKQAKALDGGGSWATAIKETVLDAIGWTVSDMILKRMMMKIQNWGLGRTGDATEPFAVSDYLGYFAGALAIGTARYIMDFEATKMEPWIKKTLRGLGFGNNYQDMLTYRSYARSTLMEDLGSARYRGFVDSGLSILKGGWQGWFGLMKPQNDIFGQILMADQARGDVWRSHVESEKEAAATRIAVSGGYRDETITTETDETACIENCELSGEIMIDPYIFEPCAANCAQYPVFGPDFQSCIAGCEAEATVPNPEYEGCMQGCTQKTGLAISTKIKNVGADIHKQMDDALSADMKRIISVDEISQLIGIFFSSVLNKTIDGMGRMFSPSSVTKTSLTRSGQDYSYNKSFKQEQTSGDRKDIRATILSNILKSMQQLSRSIIACDKDEMMYFEDYSKNLADILGAQVEALYVGLEGINLKPDFEILDPKTRPFLVNGYSWGHIPATRIPSKCRKLIDKYYDDNKEHFNATCRNIKSGLEPNYDRNCEQCIYDHNAAKCPAKTGPPGPPGPGPVPGPGPGPVPGPGPGPLRALLGEEEFKPTTVISSTALTTNQEFYNNCRKQYNTTLKMCENCLKKVDEQCSEFIGKEKEQCVTNKDLCYEYYILADDVVAPPDNNVTFYNQCLIEEKKEACYVCLKEYFVPATYCEQTMDYMGRSIIKYPALIKTDKGPGRTNEGQWVGPYDEAIGEWGDKCKQNYGSTEISLALVCRIMPEFKYGGEKLCETKCTGITPEQLRNTSDFRPVDADCGNYKLPKGSKGKGYGGTEPWKALLKGVMHVRGKCCAALHWRDSGKYSTCVGR